MKHSSHSRFRAKLFLPLLACTATAWLFRDTIRTGVALLVAGAGIATEAVEAAPQSRGSFNGFNVSNATIPTSEILSGGPGRDGIPSIDKPKFIRPTTANFMLPDDLVVSVTVGDKTRAYPLQILVWDEIVNDELAGYPSPSRIVHCAARRWSSIVRSVTARSRSGCPGCCTTATC